MPGIVASVWVTIFAQGLFEETDLISDGYVIF